MEEAEERVNVIKSVGADVPGNRSEGTGDAEGVALAVEVRHGEGDRYDPDCQDDLDRSRFTSEDLGIDRMNHCVIPVIPQRIHACDTI